MSFSLKIAQAFALLALAVMLFFTQQELNDSRQKYHALADKYIHDVTADTNALTTSTAHLNRCADSLLQSTAVVKDLTAAIERERKRERLRRPR